MAHYYTNDEVKHEPSTFTYTFNGKDYVFHSDAGVFSKRFIDYGSQALLKAVDLKDAQSLLDVGCGYGTLGIVLKGQRPELDVTMVDVNKRALQLARDNCIANHLDGVKIKESNVYENVDGTFDLIVTNPPIRAGKKVVHGILKGAKDHLNPNGRLVVVIQKKQGAPSAQKLMEEVYGNCTILKRDKGYYILESKR